MFNLKIVLRRQIVYGPSESFYGEDNGDLFSRIQFNVVTDQTIG